jgi:hypothetical protein
VPVNLYREEAPFMKSATPSLAFAAAFATPAFASDPATNMANYVREIVIPWASSPEVIEAVIARNAETANLTQDEINALDKRWRDEVGSDSKPTIDSVLGNEASQYLRDNMAASSGMITEIFVMDTVGLTVASSGVTSDYWQGDEAKYQMTVRAGPDAFFVDAIEFDESAQTYQGQVSFTLTDPNTGEPIGAVTVGLNAEAFF